MLARTPSTLKFALATAGSLGAVAAMFTPAGKAQTLANLDADIHAQRLAAMAVCDSIRDAAERVGCRAQKSIEFDEARTAAANAKAAAARKQAAEDRRAREAAEKAIAEHQKAAAKSDAATAAHRTEAECLSTISGAITGKRITPAEVRVAFKTPTETTNACEVVRRLQPRLGELTKQ